MSVLDGVDVVDDDEAIEVLSLLSSLPLRRSRSDLQPNNDVIASVNRAMSMSLVLRLVIRGASFCVRWMGFEFQCVPVALAVPVVPVALLVVTGGPPPVSVAVVPVVCAVED